ncbi:short-chain dehydrogenase [Talaromyces pinophilus]|uniref:Short-chain dehydrogenase n=1 Tax=Talaromyces pinophilus TaxID=128442 RepID=A0A478EB19_TALPI|nr:short-chain dehydrogenase [Talaromyces pinophilus]
MMGNGIPRLHNKVAVITGSSSGLGRAIAVAFASHGTKLIICADLQPEARRGSEGEDIATHEVICRAYGEGKARFVKCDVGVSEDVKQVIRVAVEDGGRLDVIVNNAGIGHTDPTLRLHQLPDSEWDRFIRINATGVYNGSKHALAQMVTQEPDAKGSRGRIINVSSVMGLVASAGGAGAYNASKAASLNLTRQIALDYARDRITANALCPGLIKTAMTRDLDEAAAMAFLNATPWGDWLGADDVAGGAVFLASDDAAVVTGIALPVDGGYVAM